MAGTAVRSPARAHLTAPTMWIRRPVGLPAVAAVAEAGPSQKAGPALATEAPPATVPRATRRVDSRDSADRVVTRPRAAGPGAAAAGATSGEVEAAAAALTLVTEPAAEAEAAAAASRS